MSYDTTPPKKVPALGYYYHYKHDPAVINNHAYEVMGVALHTEDRTYGVVYRPLYKNTFLNGANFCIRPLDMFLESVEWEGKTVARFTKITDLDVIAELRKIKNEMYPQED